MSLSLYLSEMGLEPTWCEPYEPESYASTNFATQTFLFDSITKVFLHVY